MSEVLAHSKYSASGFEAMTLCPGKRVMERGKPDKSSPYADEGTAAHSLLSDTIEGNPIPSFYAVNGKNWEVTENMATAVTTAIANIREIVADGMLLSEVQVNYASYLDVKPADGWGTSDIVAYRGTELQVHDYKHGMGVEVDADDNTQMKLYGLGALQVLRDMGEEPETVRLVIHQPRIKSAPSEWTCTIAELETWGRTSARSGVITQINAEKMERDAEWESTFLRPNDKSCKFCRAKATCPARVKHSTEVLTGARLAPDATPADFEVVVKAGTAPNVSDELAWIETIVENADLIEGWIEAARAELARRLNAGAVSKKFKLVTGKRGDRAWSDPVAAEAQLKAMRLKVEEMFSLKLISPTAAAKLAPKYDSKGVIVPRAEGEPAPLIGPRQWTKLRDLITQADGRPSVAPITDKRPAATVAATADEFDIVQPSPTAEESYA